MTDTHTGRCECGGVSYSVTGKMRDVVACHCSQCARTSGHFAAFSNAKSDAITFVSDTTLRWYRSSDEAERGFCGTCGGNLFWRKLGKPELTSIAAGTLDRPTRLAIGCHIYVASKSDYYDIADGKPQHDVS